MKRYRLEVRKLDEGKISIREFCKFVMAFEIDSLPELSACYRIYKEDGGRVWDWEDFQRAYPEIRATSVLEKKACDDFAVYGG